MIGKYVGADGSILFPFCCSPPISFLKYTLPSMHNVTLLRRLIELCTKKIASRHNLACSINAHRQRRRAKDDWRICRRGRLNPFSMMLLPSHLVPPLLFCSMESISSVTSERQSVVPTRSANQRQEAQDHTGSIHSCMG